MRDFTDGRNVWRGSSRCLALVACVVFHGTLLRAQDSFVRGDANGDGLVNLADVGTLAGTYITITNNTCLDALDFNDNDRLSLEGGDSDFQFFMNWHFSIRPNPGVEANPVLPAPFPTAGPDTTGDGVLNCVDGSATPPPPIDPDYVLDWEFDPLFIDGNDHEIFLKVTTESAVDGFSLRTKINSDVLEILDVDFVNTDPEDNLPGFTSSQWFGWSVQDAEEDGFQEILFGATFVENIAFAGASVLDFDLTQGPVEDYVLARILVMTKNTGQTGPFLALKPTTESYGPVIDQVGGPTNVFFRVGGQIFFPDGPTMAYGLTNGGEIFRRGDCNGDGAVEGSPADAVFGLSFLFLNGATPACMAACDANADGGFTGSPADPIYILQYNFRSGPPPPAPYPDCFFSLNPSDTALGCLTPPPGCEQFF